MAKIATLLVPALLLIAGCRTEAADRPEQPGITALTLHVCLRLEPDHDGPCTDEALETCPPGVSRDACLATALEEIAAAEAAATTPSGAEPPVPLPTVYAGLATLGFFLVVGVRVSRRTRARNAAAFDADLPVLAAMGFEPADATALPAAALTNVRTVRRVLVRHGDRPVWLMECEPLGTGVNSLWPVRIALVGGGPTLPQGMLAPRPGAGARAYRSTFDRSDEAQAYQHLLRSHLDPWFPQAAAQVRDEWFAVRSVASVKLPGRNDIPPIGLVALAGLAGSITGVTEITVPG